MITITSTITQWLCKVITITIIRKKHDYDYDYDYRLQSSSDRIYRLFTFSCKYARCNQSNLMFFHASFHNFTPVDASRGNMYLFHVLLAKATVIAVIICDYCSYFVWLRLQLLITLFLESWLWLCLHQKCNDCNWLRLWF